MKRFLLGILVVFFMFSFVGCGLVEEFKSTEQKELDTVSDLESSLSKHDVKVISTNYLVQSEDNKILAPDMLQCIIQNNSGYTIKDAVIAFVAWDEYNYPVKIKGRLSIAGESYVSQCEYEDINIMPGQRFGDEHGLALSHDCSNIKKFKAIVVSYEATDGTKWENPLYEKWVRLYENQKYID
ncbi:MAG: hypothetical protein IKZ23_04665 [Clostridia bacterium]|nr:hypothetical protein [Clostridia bacterium]